MNTAPVEFDDQPELNRQAWVRWNRIMQNDGRDSVGDLVFFPAGEWPRKHFDPPGYLVQHLRWQGGFGGDDPGQLTDPPAYGWAHKDDAGYPPEKFITIGISGTESVFYDQIHNGPTAQADARAAAWKSYDEDMADFWRKRLYGSPT